MAYGILFQSRYSYLIEILKKKIQISWILFRKRMNFIGLLWTKLSDTPFIVNWLENRMMKMILCLDQPYHNIKVCIQYWNSNPTFMSCFIRRKITSKKNCTRFCFNALGNLKLYCNIFHISHRFLTWFLIKINGIVSRQNKPFLGSLS